MTGLSMALMPSSEPIAGSSAFRYGCTPQVSFHLHFFKTALTHFLQAEDDFSLSNAFLDFQGMGPSSEPIASSSAFGYGHAPQVSFHLHFFKSALTHFLQAKDAVALSNAFLDFQGMGPPSSEPIASSSVFGYGRAPQVLFLHHFLQTALTHFYSLRMLLPLRMHSWIFKVWDSQLSVINCRLMNGR